MGTATTPLDPACRGPHPGAMPPPPASPWIGLIADTHGLLRPRALDALAGCERIIHAGDIGSRNGEERGILAALGEIAPVTAVRGNNDRAGWAEAIPHSARLDWNGLRIHVLHILGELTPEAAAGARVVVSGHSHKPLVEYRERVLYVNPGSAGPRRFRLPVSVGRLWREDGEARAEIVALEE